MNQSDTPEKVAKRGIDFWARVTFHDGGCTKDAAEHTYTDSLAQRLAASRCGRQLLGAGAQPSPPARGGRRRRRADGSMGENAV